MSAHLRFNEEDSEEALTDSEDEKLLQKYRNSKRQDSDSEVDVYGVGSDEEDSESENDSDIALSDVEGQEPADDDLPDIRAWGKQKKRYYGTDYVDPDYGGFEGKDAQAAEFEEEGAREMQNQLIQQLDDNDFSFDTIFKKPQEKEDEKETKKVSLKSEKLSSKEKLKVMQRDSAEIFYLIDDFKAKMTIAKDYLRPVINQLKTREPGSSKAMQFVETYYNVILNYATNINMYFLLNGQGKVKNHPIVQRLYQYRQLISHLDPVFDEIIKPQIELLLADKSLSDEIESKLVLGPDQMKSKKKLQLLVKLQSEKQTKRTKATVDSGQPSKKLKLDKQDSKHVTFKLDNSDQSSDEGVEQEESTIEEQREEDSEEVGKRAITYQIAKNKGLTPYRKKEFRNPRVKHKIKFRKALIRRKGAVREPRKELSRYSGEISGIKATVSKSIKIK